MSNQKHFIRKGKYEYFKLMGVPMSLQGSTGSETDNTQMCK